MDLPCVIVLLMLLPVLQLATLVLMCTMKPVPGEVALVWRNGKFSFTDEEMGAQKI